LRHNKDWQSYDEPNLAKRWTGCFFGQFQCHNWSFEREMNLVFRYGGEIGSWRMRRSYWNWVIQILLILGILRLQRRLRVIFECKETELNMFGGFVKVCTKVKRFRVFNRVVHGPDWVWFRQNHNPDHIGSRLSWAK
jgi:hypothetical protein